MKKEVVVMIAAGGQAKRLKKKGGKQYLMLAGRPNLYYTLAAFQKNRLIDRIIVATAPERFSFLIGLVKKYRLNKVMNIVAAGEERFFSVKNALAALPDNTEIVLVHDGARPLVSQRLISDIVTAAKSFGAAVPGLVPSDTVKAVGRGDKVSGTLDRSRLRLIQTPQGFRADIIKKAYRRLTHQDHLTDDAALVEKLGCSVKIVPGDPLNIKITHPEDIGFVEEILKRK